MARNPFISEKLRSEFGVQKAKSKQVKTLGKLLERLDIHHSMARVFEMAMQYSQYITRLIENRELPSYKRGDPDFKKSLYAKQEQYHQPSNVNERISASAFKTLSEVRSRVRVATYQRMIDAGFGEIMQALDNLLLHGESPPESHAREVWKMRTTRDFGGLAMDILEPFSDSWHFETHGKQIIAEGAKEYPDEVLKEVARRAIDAAVGAGCAEGIEKLFWYMGFPQPSQEKLLEYLKSIEHERLQAKETKQKTFLDSVPSRNGKDTTVKVIIVPLESNGHATQSAPTVRKAPRVLSERASHAAEACGKLIGNTDSLPTHLREALRRADSIITDDTSVTDALASLGKMNGQENASRRWSAMGAAAATLLESLNPLRQLTLLREHDSMPVYLQFISSVGSLLREKAGNPPPETAVAHAIDAVTTALWGAYISRRCDHSAEFSWKKKSAIPTDKEIDEVKAIYKERLAPDASPEARQMIAILDRTGMFVNLENARSIDLGTSPKDVGWVRFDHSWPEISHTYVDTRAKNLRGLDVRFIPLAEQQIETVFLTPGSALQASQAKLGGEAQFSRLPLPPESVYGPDTSAAKRLRDIAWKGHALLKETETTIRDNRLDLHRENLHTRGLSIHIVTIDGDTPRKFLLTNAEFTQCTGIEGVPFDPTDMKLIKDLGVDIQSDTLGFPLTIPAVDKKPENVDWGAIVREHLVASNKRVISLDVFERMMAAGGIFFGRRGRSKHPPLQDFRGNKRPIANEEYVNGEILKSHIAPYLLHESDSSGAPLGDLKAIAQYLEENPL